MVTPYRQGDVLEDNYNFYHSQLRINVECAFGMLVKRWAILRHPLPSAMGLNKITSLTMALCKLHNFLIDQRIERMTSTDMAHLRRGQNISLQQHEDDDVPNELLHGGNISMTLVRMKFVVRTIVETEMQHKTMNGYHVTSSKTQ